MADLSQDDINSEYVDVIRRFPSSLALKKNSASMKKFCVQRVKCSHHVSQSEWTNHLFAHKTKYTHAEQRVMVQKFIKENRPWVEKVSAVLCQKRAYTLDQYITAIGKSTYRFDELAILLLSRALRVHTFVLLEGKYWTSRADNDVSKCDFKFIYLGDLEFDYYECNVTESKFFSAPGRNPSLKTETKVETKKEEDKVDVSKSEPASDVDDAKTVEASDSDPDPIGTDEGYSSDFEPDRPTAYRLRWQGNSSSSSSDEESQSTSTDSVAKFPLKRRRGLMDTPYGDIEVTKYYHKNKARLTKYNCNQCIQTFKLQKELDRHIGSTHKIWYCNYCDKTFKTSGGLHKHERSHKNLANACTVCGKRFQFPYQVEKHARGHTARGLWKCRDCGTAFNSENSLKTHKQKHVTKLPCSDCDKFFNSKDTLAQHWRGEHGEGWTAPCGDNFKWKSRYHRHMNRCDECIDLNAEESRQRYLFK